MPIDTSLQSPHDLFIQPVQYEIPAFQRRYVWKKEEQWEPLWGDVEELAQCYMEDPRRTEPHFMGAVVLQQPQFPTGELQRRIVVDGQQRLTTLQLLLDATREALVDRGHIKPATRLGRLVVNDEEYRDAGKPDTELKVWPTVVDRIAFLHTMTSNNLSSAGNASSRIVLAHNFFKEQADQWLNRVAGSDGSGNAAADALEKAVRTRLELVVIDLGPNDDPNIIFETLNARGTPLLQSDMVKNKILHEAKIATAREYAATSEALRLWPFDRDEWWATEVGRGFQRRPRLDVYLNHWLTLRNKSEMKVYNEFNEFAKYANKLKDSGKTIHNVAADIRTLGEVFRDVEEVRRPDISRFLERRNVLNAGVVTPLLLWLLSVDVPQATLANCLRFLESFLIRRMICGYSARSYGDLFVKLIARLDDAPASEADSILGAHLAEQDSRATLWPRDRELLETFRTAPLYNWLTQGRLRMVLGAIEEQMRTTRTEVQEVPGNLHIEHILPQAWQTNWHIPNGDNEANERRNHAIHTIGNLTLVTGPLNSSLSNAAWEEKRESLYEHSVLSLNKQLVRDWPQVWDETTIEERAVRLHESAVLVWPHSGEC